MTDKELTNTLLIIICILMFSIIASAVLRATNYEIDELSKARDEKTHIQLKTLILHECRNEKKSKNKKIQGH